MQQKKLNSVWRKSTRSGTAGDCVEARLDNGNVQVRDSKDPSGPRLTFTTAEWEAFIGGVKDQEFEIIS